MPRYYTFKPGKNTRSRDVIPLKPGQELAFREGQGYYVRPKGGAAPRPAPKPAKQLTMADVLAKLGTTFLTPAQAAAQAKTIAGQTIGDQRRTLQAAQEEAEAKFDAAALASNRFGQAAADLGTGDAEVIKAAYMEAARQQGGLGASLSGEAKAAQEAAATAQNAILERMGVKGVVAAAPAGAEVAGYQGGVLPSSELAELGASAYTGALGARQAIQARGAQGAELLRYQGADTERALMGQLAELEAKRPELVRQALESVTGSNRENIATVLAALQLQNTQWDTQQDAIQAQNELIQKKNQEEAENKRLVEEGRIAALADRGFAPNGRTLLPGFYRAANGTVQKIPSWATLGPNGRIVPKPGATKGASGTPKAADYTKARESMFEAARTRLGLDQRRKARDWAGFSQADIARYVMTHVGGDFIAQYGNKARVQAMANEVAKSIYNTLHGSKKSTARPSMKPGAGVDTGGRSSGTRVDTG